MAKDDHLWPLVRRERAFLVADLEQLTPDQWATPSLCEGWTTREAVAHLTVSGAVNGPQWLWGVVLNGFSMDKQVAWQIARQLGADTAETLARFRGVVNSRRKPPLAVADVLGEVVVHGDDLRRPLGIDHDYGTDVLTAVADNYLGDSVIVRERKHAEGVTLVATDAEWRHGTGPEVTGRLVDLVMALAARPSGLERLQGPGLSVFASRFG